MRLFVEGVLHGVAKKQQLKTFHGRTYPEAVLGKEHFSYKNKWEAKAEI